MDESCATCMNCYNLTKYDYSQNGCTNSKMEGYVCMAFADERMAIWMVGTPRDIRQCEAWEPREVKNDA